MKKRDERLLKLKRAHILRGEESRKHTAEKKKEMRLRTFGEQSVVKNEAFETRNDGK